MKIMTKEDLHEVMGSHISSAVVNAALELGLFWRLADGPQTVTTIARELGIPTLRCRYWLSWLASLNLLVREGESFGLSPVARTAILATHSEMAWKMLAIDKWDGFEEVLCLGQRLRDSGPDLHGPDEGAHLLSYVQKMGADLERARLFSGLLFELHTPLAEDVADALQMDGARTMLDVGGGSGVVSLALLKRHADLYSTVVDIPNVCRAGREIADRVPERDRITYHAADFVRDELPKGFDIVLYCDVAQFGGQLLAKLASSLNEGGRLVIVNRWSDREAEETQSRLAWLLTTSLRDPGYSLPSFEEICGRLVQADLEIASISQIPYGNWTMIQARKGAKQL